MQETREQNQEELKRVLQRADLALREKGIGDEDREQALKQLSQLVEKLLDEKTP